MVFGFTFLRNVVLFFKSFVPVSLSQFHLCCCLICCQLSSTPLFDQLVTHLHPYIFCLLSGARSGEHSPQASLSPDAEVFPSQWRDAM